MKPRKNKPTEHQVRDQLRALGVLANAVCWRCGRKIGEEARAAGSTVCDRCDGRCGKKSVAVGDAQR